MRFRFEIPFILSVLSLGLLPLNETTMAQQSNTTAETVSDPFLWLEDVSGEKAIDWVKARFHRAR